MCEVCPDSSLFLLSLFPFPFSVPLLFFRVCPSVFPFLGVPLLLGHTVALLAAADDRAAGSEPGSACAQRAFLRMKPGNLQNNFFGQKC